MNARSELIIELRRLRRHIDALRGGFDLAIARDLATCLRNWVQLASVIDELASSDGWRFTFKHHVKPRELKLIRSRGSFTTMPLAGGITVGGAKVAGVAVHDRALSAEEVRRAYELSKSTFSQPTNLTFSQFLNAEGAEFKIDGTRRAVSRGEFIDRCANRLGGAHPMTVPVTADKEHWADPYVLDLYRLEIGSVPAPYAVLMETAEQIRDTFAFLDSKPGDG